MAANAVVRARIEEHKDEASAVLAAMERLGSHSELGL